MYRLIAVLLVFLLPLQWSGAFAHDIVHGHETPSAQIQHVHSAGEVPNESGVHDVHVESQASQASQGIDCGDCSLGCAHTHWTAMVGVTGSKTCEPSTAIDFCSAFDPVAAGHPNDIERPNWLSTSTNVAV